MNSSIASAKLSHAALEPDGRRRKAARIEKLLTASGVELSTARLLDIGTGSGTIASYFTSRVAALSSVDVVDERTDTDFDFRLVESEVLPFEDESFDVAISNHVIEHVDDQALHLKEITRVLRPGGVCYLATPNKLWPMEPHFHLPMLAWLPSVQLQDQYVRITRRGTRYDARLVSWGGIEYLAGAAGLRCEDLTFAMAKSVIEPKFRMPLEIGRALWPAVRRIVPSLVILLQKSDAEPVAHAD